jgi:TolB-like protein
MHKNDNQPSPLISWIQEMSRRHVFRVLALYVAIGWGFTEIVQGVVAQVGAPQAIATLATIAFIVGFPIVLFLAWVFDVDRRGVHRVPTRATSQLLVSLALAVLLSATYAIYRYLPRYEELPAHQSREEIVLAVLPFRDLSPTGQFSYLGLAVAEDLLSGVAVIPEVRVKASFSSFSMAGEDPEAFASRLGVNRLLGGTFRVQDDNLRVSARLIDTATGDVIWTRVLTDSIANIFQIEQQIARDIAGEFGLVHPSSRRTTSRQVDPEVFQLYLQAREGMINPWLDTENTISKIRQVLELEPNFPEALSMMGFLDTGRAWVMEDRRAPWLKTGEEYTLRALEIDPDLSEAYAALALNYALQYRWQDSRQTADRAIEVAGARPLNVIYAFPYNNLGHSRKTEEILLRVFDEDPLNPLATRNLMSLYADRGDYEKALQWEQLLIERGQRYQRHYLVRAYADKGDLKTAGELAALWGEEHGFPLEMGEHILEAFLTGRSEVFERATDEMVEAGNLPLGQAIWNYIGAGADEDKVFDIVRGAIPEGRFNQISLMSPDASRYRKDPRFVEIYAELGLVDYWKTGELPDFCATESVAGLCP